jgi:tetratricopeptide (TPR) repeat protein
VWLDAAVARRAPREFVFEGRGSLSFKGFAEPIAIHELAGRRAVSERSFFQGEMIGRAAERVRVTDFVRPILDSGASAWGGVLEVVGEAGLGKSRLVHEALGDPSISQRVQHFTAQTDQTLRQSFNPFTYWLKRYFEQSPLRSEAENVDAFNGRLDRLISATADAALRAELDRLRSVLGALVGLLWEGSLYSQLEPRGRHENTLIALQQLVRAEALRLPLVLVLEDAHWLDDASGEALVEFSRNLTDVPFALITLTRPVPAELSTLREIAHETLELGPLDTGEMAALALSILRAPPGPVLRALLASRAEGNPFFAEQIVRYLQEESVLEMRDGEWELVTRSRTGVLPDDLRLLFIARLDRLASALKATVQAAAILGREFEVQALSMMLRDEAEVRAHLREGEDERVWSAVSQLGYLFKHALLHTAAYEMQLTATRRQLHRLAAESLETLHAQQPSSHYAEIAYHFETACALGIAEVREEAVRYLHLAGAFQASRFENSAAIDSYTRALALTREEDATFDLLLKREDVLHLIGDRAGQGEDLDRLARIAASVERPAWRASVNLRRARHVIALADYGGASAFAEEAARWARAATDLSLESEAYTATAEIDLLQGRAEPARASYREALRLAREAGDVRRETTALIGMGACAESLSEYREAIEVYEESLHLARSASLRRLEGEILHNLGTIAHRIADLAASIDYFERAMSIRRATGDRSGEAATLYSRAIVAHIQLDYEGCLAYAQRALSLHLAIHDRRGESNDLRLVAHAYTRMNRFADARHHNARSLAIAREIGNLRGVSVSLTNLGNLAALTGQLDAAHRYFVEALAVKREIGDRHGQGDVLQNLAWISKARGEVRAIPPLIEEALTIRREIGDRRGEAFALTFLIDASVAADDWAGGERHLDEARKIARQIDELPLTLDLHAHAARLRRLRGDLDGAMDEVAPILERLDAEYHLHGDPFDIYCECVRTLRAVGDPRANPILTAVHDRLQEHANIIPEEEMRRSFLVDLPWNREIVEMWEASRNW